MPDSLSAWAVEAPPPAPFLAYQPNLFGLAGVIGDLRPPRLVVVHELAGADFRCVFFPSEAFRRAWGREAIGLRDAAPSPGFSRPAWSILRHGSSARCRRSRRPTAAPGVPRAR